jgi:hypothetical protein
MRYRENILQSWTYLVETIFPLIQNSHILMINFMLNHVAFLKSPLPQLNVEFVSWYITKSCFGVVYNIELGVRQSVFCQCSITL